MENVQIREDIFRKERIFNQKLKKKLKITFD